MMPGPIRSGASLLFDAKADVLVYGMAEQSILELAERFKRRQDLRPVRGICYISRRIPPPADPFRSRTSNCPLTRPCCRDPKVFQPDVQDFL